MTDPKRILIVEDEPLIAMMLEDFLEAVGCEVAGTADSVASAMEAIDAGGFDAVILDLNLRGGEKSDPIAERLDALGVPFAISSGDPSGAGRFSRCPQLVKPYAITQLEDVLAELSGTVVAVG